MRAKEFILPKNQWVLLISNSDKEELSYDLISLVHQAYQNTAHGSFIKSIKDVLPSDWQVLNWDKDPYVDACVFYRSARPTESWVGYKIQGIGHDGQRVSKDRAIEKMQSMLQKTGYWIESSGAVRHVLKKVNAPAVTDLSLLQKLFQDNELFMLDQDTYQRKLPHSSKIITETVFGYPVLKSI